MEAKAKIGKIFTIDLNEREASVLMALLGIVVGDQSEARKFTDNLFDFFSLEGISHDTFVTINQTCTFDIVTVEK